MTLSQKCNAVVTAAVDRIDAAAVGAPTAVLAPVPSAPQVRRLAAVLRQESAHPLDIAGEMLCATLDGGWDIDPVVDERVLDSSRRAAERWPEHRLAPAVDRVLLALGEDDGDIKRALAQLRQALDFAPGCEPRTVRLLVDGEPVEVQVSGRPNWRDPAAGDGRHGGRCVGPMREGDVVVLHGPSYIVDGPGRRWAHAEPVRLDRHRGRRYIWSRALAYARAHVHPTPGAYAALACAVGGDR